MDWPIEPHDATRRLRRRWVDGAVIASVWALIGLVFTSQSYFDGLLRERPISLLDAASSQFIFTTMWTLATPFVLWFAKRFPIDQQRWRAHLFVQLFFAALLAIIVGALSHIFYYLLFSVGGRPYLPAITLRFIIGNATENFGIYGLILLLNHSYNYYKRYREGELRASRLTTQLAQAQLQALKMQLHPHFLFNTLHSISALVHRDAAAADKMIARLGDFLRLTLENSGTQEVTLRQELEFLQCYLEIERIRFHDRLTTCVDVDPRALDTEVPNLILQPIVENAIRHGIAPRSAPGRIEIRAERTNGSLRIQVKDNGPGMSTNPISDSSHKQGLGLANTKARLSQLYGAAHRFELANDPGGGLVVTLEIPTETARGGGSHPN